MYARLAARLAVVVLANANADCAYATIALPPMVSISVFEPMYNKPERYENANWPSSRSAGATDVDDRSICMLDVFDAIRSSRYRLLDLYL